MIKVWGRRNSVNVQKVMWALGELELDYQRLDVAGSFGFPEDYRSLNPNSVVPTIQDGDLVMFESNACVRHLTRTYGAGGLWPVDTRQLAIADQWMDWQSSTFMPAFFQVFLNMIRLPPDRANEAVALQGTKNTAVQCAKLDQALEGRDFLAGEISMADIVIGAPLYRYFTMNIERPSLPNLEAYYARLSDRPAYQTHVMIPFGSNHAEWDELEKASAGIQ